VKRQKLTLSIETPIYRRFNEKSNKINLKWCYISVTRKYLNQISRHRSSQKVFEYVLLALGVFSAAFGLKGFLLPNTFIDGGAMGLSLIAVVLTGIPLSVLVVLINIPFIVMGYKQISPEFAFKTLFAIIGLAIVLALVDYSVVTNDKVLIAVFGGFFLGAGIGLAVRGGGVLDGTEVLALYVSKRTPLSIGDVILIFNIIMFLTAALLFGIEIGLYSILTYISASRTLDFVVQGIEEYTGALIVSKKSDEIRLALIDKLGRGVTEFKGKSGFGKRGHTDEIDVIFSVVTRLEISKLKQVVKAIDPTAFLAFHSINDTVGGMVKKRPLK
jgi:uncharacterized membrane-anchored protein YitT (DUF2179 family)